MQKWEYNAVNRLKRVGETITDNAEKMIGGYRHQTGYVQIVITIGEDAIPKIEVHQELISDKLD